MWLINFAFQCIFMCAGGYYLAHLFFERILEPAINKKRRKQIGEKHVELMLHNACDKMTEIAKRDGFGIISIVVDDQTCNVIVKIKNVNYNAAKLATEVIIDQILKPHEMNQRLKTNEKFN